MRFFFCFLFVLLLTLNTAIAEHSFPTFTGGEETENPGFSAVDLSFIWPSHYLKDKYKIKFSTKNVLGNAIVEKSVFDQLMKISDNKSGIKFDAGDSESQVNAKSAKEYSSWEMTSFRFVVCTTLKKPKLSEINIKNRMEVLKKCAPRVQIIFKPKKNKETKNFLDYAAHVFFKVSPNEALEILQRLKAIKDDKTNVCPTKHTPVGYHPCGVYLTEDIRRPNTEFYDSFKSDIVAKYTANIEKIAFMGTASGRDPWIFFWVKRRQDYLQHMKVSNLNLNYDIDLYNNPRVKKNITVGAPALQTGFLQMLNLRFNRDQVVPPECSEENFTGIYDAKFGFTFGGGNTTYAGTPTSFNYYWINSEKVSVAMEISERYQSLDDAHFVNRSCVGCHLVGMTQAAISMRTKIPRFKESEYRNNRDLVKKVTTDANNLRVCLKEALYRENPDVDKCFKNENESTKARLQFLESKIRNLTPSKGYLPITTPFNQQLQPLEYFKLSETDEVFPPLNFSPLGINPHISDRVVAENNSSLRYANKILGLDDPFPYQCSWTKILICAYQNYSYSSWKRSSPYGIDLLSIVYKKDLENLYQCMSKKDFCS